MSFDLDQAGKAMERLLAHGGQVSEDAKIIEGLITHLIDGLIDEVMLRNRDLFEEEEVEVATYTIKPFSRKARTAESK